MHGPTYRSVIQWERVRLVGRRNREKYGKAKFLTLVWNCQSINILWTKGTEQKWKEFSANGGNIAHIINHFSAELAMAVKRTLLLSCAIFATIVIRWGVSWLWVTNIFRWCSNWCSFSIGRVFEGRAMVGAPMQQSKVICCHLLFYLQLISILDYVPFINRRLFVSLKKEEEEVINRRLILFVQAWNIMHCRSNDIFKLSCPG